MSSNDLKWDQLLRFRLIEIIALWEGRLTTNHLCQAFQIGRQQASRDINRYQSLFDNEPLVLDRSIKGYKPSTYFSPRFTKGTASEYLTMLHQQNEMVEAFDFFEMGYAESEVLKVPERLISPIVLRVLIQAAREQRRVDIDYVSLSSPQVSGRILVPHTIVNDGFRWHVRAYCEKRSQYRDFVLSRFRNAPEILDKSDHGREGDTDWNEIVDIKVVSNPYLDDAQQAVVAQDYAMINGCISIKSRKALVSYAVKRLNICLDKCLLKRNPEEFQLTAFNCDLVRKYLIS